MGTVRPLHALEVLATGPSALIQDLGRPGYAHLGVPPSGALDRPALRLANRLVGNPERAAGIEVLLGGLELRLSCARTVAVTGPGVPVTVEGRPVGSHLPVYLRAGQRLAIGSPERGLRCYLAVSGGIDEPAELGSRSTDVLSGIGPKPLKPGRLLALGRDRGIPAGADVLRGPEPPAELIVPMVPGPRDDWFDDLPGQLGVRWTVTEQSNRVGLRLDGPALRRIGVREDEELPSEGIVTGAIQLPPSGLPVVFLADHPTTGGYPVVGVVRPDALAGLAQARPGTVVRFLVRTQAYSAS